MRQEPQVKVRWGPKLIANNPRLLEWVRVKRKKAKGNRFTPVDEDVPVVGRVTIRDTTTIQ